MAQKICFKENNIYIKYDSIFKKIFRIYTVSIKLQQKKYTLDICNTFPLNLEFLAIIFFYFLLCKI